MSSENHSHTNKKKQSPLKGAWHVFFSAVAAAFGVQSEKNRQKDFSTSSPWPYIFAGLAFTVVFVLVLVAIVKFVIS
jgi:hypothetical protein